MRVEILAVPDCPNAALLQHRITAALAGLPPVQVMQRVIVTEADAKRFGMHGSPTLLIDGKDPFAGPGAQPSLSCRLYQPAAGPAEGAPSVLELRDVLSPRGSESLAGG